jgi:hypothetical protein
MPVENANHSLADESMTMSRKYEINSIRQTSVSRGLRLLAFWVSRLLK